MNKLIFTTLFILFISTQIYSQNNCKEEDKERAKSIVKNLESDNAIRFSVEQGTFGDCIHYRWMDEMRRLGVKQVAATLVFVWNDKIEKLKISKISFLPTYYKYDTELKDKKLLEQIENLGLKKQIEEVILEKAKDHVFVLIESLKRNYKEGLLKKQPKGKISGIIYQNLLDDESLPVLIEMPTVDF